MHFKIWKLWSLKLNTLHFTKINFSFFYSKNIYSWNMYIPNLNTYLLCSVNVQWNQNSKNKRVYFENYNSLSFSRNNTRPIYQYLINEFKYIIIEICNQFLCIILCIIRWVYHEISFISYRLVIHLISLNDYLRSCFDKRKKKGKQTSVQLKNKAVINNSVQTNISSRYTYHRIIH